MASQFPASQTKKLAVSLDTTVWFFIKCGALKCQHLGTQQVVMMISVPQCYQHLQEYIMAKIRCNSNIPIKETKVNSFIEKLPVQ